MSMSKYCRALFLLLALLMSCSSPEVSTAPLLRIRLNGLPADANKVKVTITVNGIEREVEFTPNGSEPLDVLTVSFPQDTMGDVTIAILAEKDGCLVGSGGGSISLNSNEVRELPISISTPPLACGEKAAQIIVQVINGINAMGKVTAVSPSTGIDCGQDCEELLKAGSQIVLHAEASQGSFLGWSGACTDTNDCIISTAPEGGLYTVQALFGVRPCVGWCPDPTVPPGFNSHLYGITGTGQGNIVAVGENGKILRFNGTTWAEEQSGLTQALRAVTVIRGTTPATYVAVGDSGKAVYNSGGTTWTAITGQTTRLRSVMAYNSGGNNNIYAVGDNGTFVKGSLTGLSNAPTGGESPPSGLSGKTLNSIALQVNNSNSSEFIIVGEMGTNARRTIFITYDSPATPSAAMLQGVWFSSGRLVAVGGTGATATIFSRSYNFGWQGWQTEMAPVGVSQLHAVWGSAENNIIAVGDGGSIAGWDGTAWGKRTNPINKNLNAVWGTGASNLYAVGEGGTILHYLP